MGMERRQWVLLLQKYGHCSWICSSSVGALVVTLFALLTPSETECTIRARFDKAFSFVKAALWPLTSYNSDVPGCYRIFKAAV